MIKLLHFQYFRGFCTAKVLRNDTVNWEYYCNPNNFTHIFNNVLARKVSCDLINVGNQLKDLHNAHTDPEKFKLLKETLLPKLMWFPNDIHPRVLENKSETPVIVKKVGRRPSFSYFPTNFEHLTKRLNVLRTKNLGHMSGNKSYYLKGDLALLENALVQFAIKKLLKKNFQLMSVPDIVSKSCLQGCGMKTDGVHSQIYHIDSWAEDMCLSGTSEIAFGSYLSSKLLSSSCLPMKFCAMSRCYRAEAKKHQKERGIFRVHQFTKVEMFGVTANETGQESEELLKEFTEIQEEIYSELGLYFKVLEMPPCELGLPAYHKYDMEAWIPTQKIFGEISSASNCTDFQSRRLNIKYCSPSSGEEKYCHTVNGTAVAIPRLLITILENFQNLDGSICIPIPLQEFFKKDVIEGKLNEMMACTKPTK